MPSDESSYEECHIEPGKGLKFVSNAVKENLEHFSEAMKKRASKARKVCAASGTPNISSFKTATPMRIIKNNTVTTEDIQLAKKA